MKIIVLGGGSDQISLLERLNARNCECILIDYYENPPAKPLASRHHRVSTLDVAAVEQVARMEKPDRILTACIDQALLSAAEASERCGLPFYLSAQKAREVTHKAMMKARFAALSIPTARHVAVASVEEFESARLRFPLVVKPADSNGSFGVRRVRSPEEAREAIATALSVSRSARSVIEEFIEGDELSVDAFIDSGKARVLLITRSEKQASETNFAINRSHFPAGLSEAEREQVRVIAQQIADGFQIPAGPMIIQLLRGKEGLSVVEFSARIAGGSKHHLIQRVTGFDVMEAFVRMALGEPFAVDAGQRVSHAATTYGYCLPGIFQKMAGADELLREGIIDAIHLYKTPGMEIQGHGASRDRPASYITTASSQAELEQKLAAAEARLRVLDTSGNDITLARGKAGA